MYSYVTENKCLGVTKPTGELGDLFYSVSTITWLRTSNQNQKPGVKNSGTSETVKIWQPLNSCIETEQGFSVSWIFGI